MRVMILGAGGMLGQDVYKRFIKNECEVHASDIDVNEDWLVHADVRDYSDLRSVAWYFKPDWIINLAALTDLEYCEVNRRESFDTNALGAEITCDIANELGATHVYISTAGIFDGELDSYHEYDVPNPLSIYGQSKYAGEQICLRKAKRGYVFRAGWMMGGFEKDKKFVKKIIDQVVEHGNDKIYAVIDKYGTPTYTKDFARSIFNHLAEGTPYGLYNQVGQGHCNRFDVAKVICDTLFDGVEVIPVTSDMFNFEYFAPRPKSEVLTNMKLDNLDLNWMRNWKVALAEYLTEWKELL